MAKTRLTAVPLDEEPFKDRLRRLMEDQGFSQVDLAHAARVGQEAIKRLISGGSKEPSAPTLLRLAKTLGVSPYYLLGEFEPYSRATEQPSQRAEPLQEQPVAALVQSEVTRAIAPLQAQVDRLERLLTSVAEAGKQTVQGMNDARTTHRGRHRKGARPS